MGIESVAIKDFKINYLHFGNAQKPKLVLMPGLSIQSVLNSAAAIEKQYALLAENFDMYLFDRRENVQMGYSIEDMASDTLAAIDVLNIPKINIVGVSQGGMIAQVMAIKKPDLINAMVLCSTSAEVNPKDEGILNWINLAKQKDAQSLLDSFFKQVYTSQFYETHKRAVKVLARYIKDEDLERFIILATPILGFNVKEDIKKLNIPTFVCGSKKDNVVPFWCIEELITLLNAKSWILEDSSHALYDESPLFIPKLLEFFQQNN